MSDPGGHPELIFVGGTGRSGTHILGRLIGAHPHFAGVPIEARFHCNKLGMPDLLAGRIPVATYLEKLRGFWWHRVRVDAQPRGLYNLMSKSDFDSALDRFESSFGADPAAACRRLYLDLLWRVAEREGKPALVEMSSHNVKEAKTLLTLFPKAKLIHTFRDGRDAASSVTTKTWGPETVVGAIDWWADRLRDIDAGLSTDGGSLAADSERFHPVLLDDLVHGDREAAFAELTGFLGRGEDPAMRRFFDLEMSSDDAHAGRWQEGIGRFGAARIKRRYEKTLNTLKQEGNHVAAPLIVAYERSLSTAGESLMPRILFATSNGTGMGHLTRAMAIAKRLDDQIEPFFFTLSAAAPIVATHGHHVEYFPSYRQPGSGSDWQWNRRLRSRFELLLEELKPDLVVFDGVHPYRAITHVLGLPGAPPSVWCRRPMWRAGAGAPGLNRAGAFDAVLEPGEIASDADTGLTTEVRDQATVVGPIIYTDASDLLDRATAEAELGLKPGRINALVNLGQGGDLDHAVAETLALLSDDPEMQIVALESSLSPAIKVPEEVIHLRSKFPIARLFNAFDLAISAAGYNAFHELIAQGPPSLFVPMARDLDDQAARARWAGGAGLALACNGPADPMLSDRVAEIMEPEHRQKIAAARSDLAIADGASEAARLLERCLAEGVASAFDSIRDHSRLNRWLRHSAHPIGPSLPLVAALTARDLIRNPAQRTPKLVLLATGLGPGSMMDRVRAELDRRRIDAGRVQVITDSWDLSSLRKLGVAIERLPREDEFARMGATDAVTARKRRFVELMREHPTPELVVLGDPLPAARL